MSNRIAIVGAGPVGLTLGLLLKKFKVPITLIERNPTLGSHPSAHYINLRTMEIFSELYDIDKQIHAASEPVEQFRYFRYLRRLFEKDNNYGMTDQFAPSVEDKAKEIRKFSYSFPAHLPQHTLVDILNKELMNHLDSNDKLLLNREFSSFDNQGQLGTRIVLKNKSTQQLETEECELLVACDGFRGKIRDTLKIGLQGNRKLQNFLNIYFKSPKLGNLLLDKGENAMLHFIYNYKVVAVLVNHSYKRGEFVLQVPISPQFEDVKSFTEEKCLEIINNCIDSLHHLRRNDLKIENIGFWTLSGVIAEKYFRDHVVLCGDAAHSFPPAGGFGMNTGIQDAYNLAFKAAYLLKNRVSEEEYNKILTKYWEERRSHAHFNLSTAMRYYKNSLDIASYLGLKKQNLDLFEGALRAIDTFLPRTAQPRIFELGKMVGSYHLELTKPRNCERIIGIHEDYTIPLIFLKEETMWRYTKNKEDAENKDEIDGMLCPHVFLEDSEGKSLSLRQLPQFLYKRRVSRGHQNPESFYIVLRFEDSIGENIAKKVEKVVEDEIIRGDIVHVQVVNRSKLEESSTGNKKDENAVFCRGFYTLLEKLKCKESNVIVIRSDATVIARL